MTESCYPLSLVGIGAIMDSVGWKFDRYVSKDLLRLETNVILILQSNHDSDNRQIVIMGLEGNHDSGNGKLLWFRD